MTSRQKRKWAASLKPGDLVENCSYEVKKVKKVQPFYSTPLWLLEIAWFFEIYFGAYWLAESLEKWAQVCKLGLPVDVDLVMEDGQGCSAVHCCDPVERKETQ